MPNVDTSQLAEVMVTFTESAEAALDSSSAAEFEHLERELSEIDGYVRELQQAMWASEAEQTLQRLEGNEPLMPVDKDVIRTFLVADAEYYLANENNYNDWVQELRRLTEELVRRSRTITRENVGDFRGIVKDAVRLIPDIRNFLEERARVERFDLAVDGLDDRTRKMLIRLIREQLTSPNR